MLKEKVINNIEAYRALRDYVDSLGFGYAKTEAEEELNFLADLFEPDEAVYTVKVDPTFTSIQTVAERMGVDEATAADKLYTMSVKGLLYREKQDGVYMYRAAPALHGFVEFNTGRFTAEMTKDFNVIASEPISRFYEFLPFQRCVPVRPEAVAPGELLPEDDVRAYVKKADKIALAMCVCRELKAVDGFICPKPLYTCLQLNEWAEYYVENGTGKYISNEEALKILDQSDEVALSIHMSNDKNPEVICNCCNCCCGLITSYTAFPDQEAFKMITNYYVQSDIDKCTGCGICEERCQTKAISIVDGKISINTKICDGCGLCVTKCPENVNILRRKENIYLPEGETWFDTYKNMHEIRDSRSN